MWWTGWPENSYRASVEMTDPLSMHIDLPAGFEASAPLLALGGELKSSLCLLRDGRAQMSEAIGDLEQEHVYRSFITQLDALFALSTPAQLVIDKHPDYLSSQWGEKRAQKFNIGLTAVQHHHAHITSVMADSGLQADAKPLLGIALDGLGFGDDGSLWGGEILLADYRTCERLACLQPAAMIGGAVASREPWRNTLAHLLPIWDQVCDHYSDVDMVQFLQNKPLPMLQSMLDKGLNAPLASSCGRLFDAVAACLGVYREQVSFEAQAAIALEKLATTCFEQANAAYAYRIDDGDLLQLNWQPMWLELLADIQLGIEAAVIASRFHHTLISALTRVVQRLREKHEFDTIALSGGVFQNRLLSTYLPRVLEADGFTVLQHNQVPPHDGGLSLGQAVIAAARGL
ncbi:hydrogenase maturation protein HypF [Mariprofundus micogutta]|uniref:Carbamoyltransferase HypF n=1 Tax=Mariprofundus micogutta TaxID=1921010 RepID=A0A1L8CNN4_9PROT|nr:carbamoyltransferase HypF [Mariprofundus micogutta]GAV20515.1 hydrogenase maturation protein HypF [Mariprofundus micogutta]